MHSVRKDELASKTIVGKPDLVHGWQLHHVCPVSNQSCALARWSWPVRLQAWMQALHGDGSCSKRRPPPKSCAMQSARARCASEGLLVGEGLDRLLSAVNILTSGMITCRLLPWWHATAQLLSIIQMLQACVACTSPAWSTAVDTQQRDQRGLFHRSSSSRRSFWLQPCCHPCSQQWHACTCLAPLIAGRSPRMHSLDRSEIVSWSALADVLLTDGCEVLIAKLAFKGQDARNTV